jgi:hypothetical protein
LKSRIGGLRTNGAGLDTISRNEITSDCKLKKNQRGLGVFAGFTFGLSRLAHHRPMMVCQFRHPL